MTVGYGSGEKRIIKAMKDALNSPLLNTKEIEKAQRLLYIIYSCNEKPVSITELGEINDFMDTLPEDLEVLWGLYPDDTIGDQVKVAVVATGFDKARQQKDSEKSENVKKLWEMYYPEPKPLEQEEAEPLEDSPEEEEEESLVGWKERGQSWFKSFVEFMKKSLEEE